MRKLVSQSVASAHISCLFEDHVLEHLLYDGGTKKTSEANAIQIVPQHRAPQMTRKDKATFFPDQEIKYCRSEGAIISDEAVKFMLRQWDFFPNKSEGVSRGSKASQSSVCYGERHE